MLIIMNEFGDGVQAVVEILNGDAVVDAYT